MKGWLLLRLSLHDPLMPLNLEGERPGDCDRLVAVVKELLAATTGSTCPRSINKARTRPGGQFRRRFPRHGP